MPSFYDLTTAQLKQAVQIREQIESLQAKLSALMGGIAPASSGLTKGKRVLSATTKKKMAAAQQARWAKVKGKPTPAKIASKKTASADAAVPKKRGAITPEGRAKLAAAMKARWAARRKVAAGAE